jgi:hypothetical protein
MFRTSIGIFILLLASSCANYKLNITKRAKAELEKEVAPTGEIAHTMYLIGDAGNAKEGKAPPPALTLLKEKLEKANPNSSVIFLGDNIYPDGMAPKREKEERAADVFRMDAQLDILKNFKGRPFFVAGNHDWAKWGLDGVKRQEKYIEKKLNRGNVFVPDAGCGDPKEIEINENLVILAIDSQWFLQDWDGETEINDGCEVKSRFVFNKWFEEALKSHRNKNVVIAMHHPLYSNGPHGGYDTPKEHFFPLTQIKDELYIPMPIIGTIGSLLRASVGIKQDLAHPQYKELKEGILAGAKKNGSFIFAAGHEHTLQYFEKDKQHFIVSGAGSKRSPAKTGNGASFAYGQYGFTQLDFYEDGRVYMKFWAAYKDKAGEIVYQKQIKDALPSAKPETNFDFSEFEKGEKEKTYPVTDKNFEKGALGRALWGKHYREAYEQSITVPTVDLSKFRGGMTPVKRGGGYQTNSLRIIDPKGKQFVMRSLDKDESRIVPYPFNESFVVNIFKDNFSAAHPLAAMTLPEMADAAGVYHTNPQVVYIAKQPALGAYNDLFGGGLYLLEERPAKDWSDLASFGNSKKIISTYDVIENLTKKHHHKVDQDAAIRARLFDILIGDWDRHDDQWRWASFKEGEETIYRPIPRDRDQVYSKYDGLLFSVLRYTIPFLKQLRKYDAKIPPNKVKWVNYHSRHFDKTFMTEGSWEQWEAAANHIKTNVTDEIIEAAIKKWPKEIYDIDGPETIKVLKQRRDDILDYAHSLYSHLAKKVDVLGTEKKDYFLVQRLDDERTRVMMLDTNKKREKEAKLYDRIFKTSETKEIILYGLGEDDVFEITGKVKNGILIRAIGGLDEDTFIDKSEVSNGAKKTLIYDAKEEKTNLELGPESRNLISDRPEHNQYNHRSWDYEMDWSIPFVSITSNPDDGLLVGGSATFTKYGFKKDPFASVHTIGGAYAFQTKAFSLNYSGEWIDAVKDWNLLINAELRGPLYARNFFGLGNEPLNFEENLGENYHRVRHRLYSLYPALNKRFAGDGASFSVGPLLELSEIKRTEGRFIDDIGEELGTEAFESQTFIGGQINFNYSNLALLELPNRGVNFDVNLSYRANAKGNTNDFAAIQSSLTLYQNIGTPGILTLATRVGIQHNFTNDFEFYQGAILGGNGPGANLRGFRRDRFTGQTAFYQNIDLRLKLFEVKTKALPFSVGVFGGFDYGRVWVDGEESDTWHKGIGGGLYFAPFDIFAINFSYFKGDDDLPYFNFGGGFFF